MLIPATEDEVRQAVAALPQVRVRGGGTKSALSAEATLSTAALCGIREYEPSEFTITALAGTPLSVVRDALAANGQYLPFDPPLAGSGATLGGTVAAGLAGSGRFQYGGVRDFLIGVRLVTGDGRMVRGGGKVVKNAAGFDIPKLMIGSLGRLGVLTEVVFKVFPAPLATATISAEFERLEEAVTMLERLASSRLGLAALDLIPADWRAGGVTPPLASPVALDLRLGGLREALPGRIARVQEFVGTAAAVRVLENDGAYWQQAGEFAWVPKDHALAKLPLAPAQIAECESFLAAGKTPVPRRYSVGGNVAWLAWPAELPRSTLEQLATTLKRLLLIVRDNRRFVVPESSHPFLQRLRSVFDPQNKFV